MSVAPYVLDDSGPFRTTSEGEYVVGIGGEIDFYDDPDRNRLPYTGPNKDISDLWKVVEKDFATSGSHVFETKGFNKDGSPTPHSCTSLPRFYREKQDAYLPYYPKPGDSIGVDLWMGKVNGPTYRMMFGVRDTVETEYVSMNQLNLYTGLNLVQVARETDKRGGKVNYDTVEVDDDFFKPNTRFTLSVDWHEDYEFTGYVKGVEVSTRNDSKEVPQMGRGIGYEVSSHGVGWWDSYRKL